MKHSTRPARLRALAPLALLALTLGACGGSSSSPTSSIAGATPKNLSFVSNPAVYALDVEISPNLASATGKVTGWSVSPALPAGLSLDPLDGTIRGTPSVASELSSYTVRAANAFGATKLKLDIEVVLPSSFAVSTSLSDDTLSVHVVDAQSGKMRPWSVTAAGPGEDGSASVVASEDGSVVYAVNRDGDSISIYDLDLAQGRLVARAPLATGGMPFDFVLHPAGDAAYLSLLAGGLVQAYAVDPNTGDLSPIGAPLLTGGEPKAMAVDAAGERLYVGNGSSRTLRSFDIDPKTRALTVAGPDEPTGMAPLGIAVTRDGRHMFVVNARSSSLSIFAKDPDSGLPTHIEDRFVGLLPTDVVLDSTSTYVYVAVSGENLVRAYEFHPKVATLSEAGPAVPTGQQPSTLRVDASGRFLYTANTSSNDVSQFAVDASNGALSPVELSATRDQPLGLALLSGDSPATPAPRFAYVSNRGSGDLSTFSADSTSGALTVVGNATLVGNSPRGLALDPWSRFLYTVDSDADTLTSFAIQQSTGELTQIGTPLATGAGPRAVEVDRSARFLYVANFEGHDISRYALDLDTGLPSFVGTVATGTSPVALSIDPTGRFLHVATQGDDSLATYAVDAVDGGLSLVASPLVVSLEPLSLEPHPSGRFLFATFVSQGRLTVFPLDSISGAPSGGFSVSSGTRPSAIAIDPLGLRAFATNEDPTGVGDLSTFDLNADNAHPSPVSSVLAGVNPVDTQLDPSGKFLYVAGAGSDDVHVFNVSDPAQPPIFVGVWPVGVSPDSIVVAGSLAD